MGKNNGKINFDASRRIQSSQDKKGSQSNSEFKARTMSAADRNAKKNN